MRKLYKNRVTTTVRTRGFHTEIKKISTTFKFMLYIMKKSLETCTDLVQTQISGKNNSRLYQNAFSDLTRRYLKFSTRLRTDQV